MKKNTHNFPLTPLRDHWLKQMAKSLNQIDGSLHLANLRSLYRSAGVMAVREYAKGVKAKQMEIDATSPIKKYDNPAFLRRVLRFLFQLR